MSPSQEIGLFKPIENNRGKFALIFQRTNAWFLFIQLSGNMKAFVWVLFKGLWNSNCDHQTSMTPVLARFATFLLPCLPFPVSPLKGLGGNRSLSNGVFVLLLCLWSGHFLDNYSKPVWSGLISNCARASCIMYSSLELVILCRVSVYAHMNQPYPPCTGGEEIG